jgi:hypothetical protein
VRFSDQQLQSFHDSWRTHRNEVDKHIERFLAHITTEEARWHELIMSTQQNRDLMREHIDAYRAQEQALKELIILYETGQAGIKIAKWLGKFAVWMTSLSGLALAGHFLLDHFFGGRPPP